MNGDVPIEHRDLLAREVSHHGGEVGFQPAHRILVRRV
jgi:hypothetical protein